jgi:purine-binding chemotaxis protein CheW
MSNVTAMARGASGETGTIAPASNENDVVSMTVAGQLFGIPVQAVQDVLGPQRITRVPLAPGEVAGSLNLRGRIVTAIDVRRRLRLEPRPKEQPGMNVVVESGGELYSLIVDQVGEVLSLPGASYERNPATLDTVWREVSGGIYRLKEGLLIMVDVSRLIGAAKAEAA